MHLYNTVALSVAPKRAALAAAQAALDKTLGELAEAQVCACSLACRRSRGGCWLACTGGVCSTAMLCALRARNSHARCH